MDTPRFRRCRMLVIQPVEHARFSLQSLLEGGNGLAVELGQVALAGHLDGPRTICREDADLLLTCSADTWQPLPDDPHRAEQVGRLIERGLLISEGAVGSVEAEADQTLRSSNWWPLAAVFHRQSRWAGVDSVSEMEKNQMITARDLVRQLGVPPSEASARHPDVIPLPRDNAGELDECLLRRTTCRNFELTRPLPLSTVAGMLEHVLMARSSVEPEPGVRFLKKNVPSAGGLHPIEAYLIVRSVEGLDPGVYHYHAVAHELALMPTQPPDLGEFGTKMLSGQHWFADAHVLVVLVCRFERNFWKYRQHAKAYRAVTLDAGHISQALYTAATLQGLGAFVTAAINDSDVEAVLGLDPMKEGPLAVCGFGWRAGHMQTAEMDPAGRVWKIHD